MPILIFALVMMTVMIVATARGLAIESRDAAAVDNFR